MQIIKFFILGVIKTIINTLIYVLMLNVGLNTYISFSISTFFILIFSYFFNKNYIFYTEKTNGIAIFLKYIFIFFVYIILSYINLFLLSKTSLPENLHAIFVSGILFIPNFLITKHIFK